MTIILPWLLAMAVLISLSAFFSASEAALFSITPAQRDKLDTESRRQRAAARLLQRPDRLLSAVLFWNLAINLTYFAITARVGLLMSDSAGSSEAALFSAFSLLTLIFLSEMLPKSLAILRPVGLASQLAMPLSLFVRLVDPLMPVLQFFQLVLRRLLLPRFQAEPGFDQADVERAVKLSRDDAQLAEREQRTLENIVELSEIRVDEWMRPRRHFLAFNPPVNLSDLQGQMTPSSYLLVTERDSEDIQSAIPLKNIARLPEQHLEHHATAVLHVPWVATVADALQLMDERQREVATVLNEFGETFGILTMDDILDSLFRDDTSRSGRLFSRAAIEQVEQGCWHVMGITSIYRLGRHFNIDLPGRRGLTVAGVIQKTLARLPESGDECQWGPFQLRVLEIPQQGHLLVELRWDRASQEQQ